MRLDAGLCGGSVPTLARKIRHPTRALRFHCPRVSIEETKLEERRQKRIVPKEASQTSKVPVIGFDKRLSPVHRRLTMALIKWRYGLDASGSGQPTIIFVPSSEATSEGELPLRLPGDNMVLLRQVADQLFPIVKQRPTIFALPDTDDWLVQELRKFAEVQLDVQFPLFVERVTQELQGAVKEQLREHLRQQMHQSDYVVVQERKGLWHAVVAAWAGSRPVFAEATSLAFQMLADVTASRREDLVALVAGWTGCAS